MNNNEYNQYGQLTVDQKRWVDYLREDYGFSVEVAIKELDHHDWNYEVCDRSIRESRPDI
ncbi:hypothetical protein D3C75_1124940 [compost metagenome]